MSEYKRIVNSVVQREQVVANYGRTRVKLAALLDERHMTRNKLKDLIGCKFDVVDRYYKAENIALVDLDFISKVCYVLDCSISDLLEYEPPSPDDPNI